MDRRDCAADVGFVGQLAVAIADGDFSAVQRDLDRFVRCARRAGVPPLLLDVVADHQERTIVRQRAFGRAAGELARLAPEGDIWRATGRSPAAIDDDPPLPHFAIRV